MNEITVSETEQPLVPRNFIPLSSGRVRLVCKWCGRKTGSRESTKITSLPLGWWMAPFPVDYVHEFDGSCGPEYTCPDCDRLSRERQAAGIRPLLTPDRTRGH